MIEFDLLNVLRGNGFVITLTGMLIVFSGLLLISLFITLLPRTLSVLDRITTANTPPPVTTTARDNAPTEQQIMAAISLAIHMELERCGGELQRITIQRRQPVDSFWTSAGKMRSLSNRSPHA